MNSEKNIELVRNFFEQHSNKSDSMHYEEFVSPNVVVHGPGTVQEKIGIEHAKEIDKDYFRNKPGRTFSIEEIFSYTDKVYLRWNCTGRHKKILKAGDTKDSTFSITGFSIYRIKEGKIVQIWKYWDRLGLLEQLVEVSIQSDTAESGHYLELLKSLGRGKYFKDVPLLSKRERQCLQALLLGETAKEVASRYTLSFRTIESYYENLKNKLNCQTKRDLFKAAQALEKLQLI